MREIIENLLALQKLINQALASSPEQTAKIAELRKPVPLPILDHFDRMISRGRNGVALVRHGMCGECHLRIPVGTLASLVAPQDVYLCETCACYLILPLEERAGAIASLKPQPIARRVRVKAAQPETAATP
jgi:predicted  nucleic acid-binding Zn-ribbon protein